MNDANVEIADLADGAHMLREDPDDLAGYAGFFFEQPGGNAFDRSAQRQELSLPSKVSVPFIPAS